MQQLARMPPRSVRHDQQDRLGQLLAIPRNQDLGRGPGKQQARRVAGLGPIGGRKAFAHHAPGAGQPQHGQPGRVQRMARFAGMLQDDDAGAA
ncbi:hypothetical protein D3C71_1799740 [compost metagenome]